MNANELDILKRHAQDGSYTPHGRLKDAECVIGFSFGYREREGKITPGVTNERLAAFIESQFPNVPLIVQFEIADALKSRSPSLRITESRIPDDYLHSREIAEQALEHMHQHGWVRAALVTHPAMMARNDAICRQLGIETILPSGLEMVPYDSLSAQPWTRDSRSWWKRERNVIDICIARQWI